MNAHYNTRQWKHKQINLTRKQINLITVSEPSAMKPNVVDQTCELLK